MNLSTWSIHRPAVVALLFIMLSIVGALAFKALPIQNMPNIDVPTISVSIAYPGANPSAVETEVTKKIEDAIAQVADLDTLSSTVSDGMSSTIAAFKLEKDSQEALTEVRDVVTSIRSSLPVEVLEPQIQQIKLSGGALATYAVRSSTKDISDLSYLVSNELTKKLLSVPGVNRVVRQGGVDREILVELDLAKMNLLAISPADVSRVLAQSTKDLPSGVVRLSDAEQSLRLDASVSSVEQLAKLPIAVGTGKVIRLADVATISDTSAEIRQAAFLNGAPVVSFQVFKSTGASEVAILENMQPVLAEFSKQHADLSIELVNTTTERISENYKASIWGLFEGSLLAVLVVFLFLRDKRATLIPATALPLSILPTFAAMYLLDFSLNGITLLALTLVTGILVDDAIVEVENIIRHLRMGKTPMQAAIDASTEIGTAVIATTLTLVAVFLPTAFMPGIPGKFFEQFGATAAIAVLASLLVARMLTPLLAAYWLKSSAAASSERDEGAHGHHADGPIMLKYLQAVRWCLSNPWKTNVFCAAFFLGSLGLASQIPAGFLPSSETGQLNVSLELAPGATPGQTAQKAQTAYEILRNIPELSSIYTAVGAGSSGRSSATLAEVRKASLILQLREPQRNARSEREVESEVRTRLNTLTGVKVVVGSAGSGRKAQIALGSDNATLLQDTARELESQLRTLPGYGSISSSASLSRPELSILIDNNRAAELGVNTAALASVVRIATAADNDNALAKLNLEERQLPIRVRFANSVREQQSLLEQIKVPGNQGMVSLGNIATLQYSDGPVSISRYNRSRNITVSLELNGVPLGVALKDIKSLPLMQNLPQGVFELDSSDSKSMRELFTGFGLAMLAGLFCVYAIMVILFNDPFQPFTVLAAIPLSAGGAFLGLALFGYSFSMPALIGLLMLMGLVTKNSILLVEYAIEARRRGMSEIEALLDACHKRAQPIVMTTVAMVAGMLPLALGLSGDSSFRSPMALAVIGGLLTSTVLSLLVVPTAYTMVAALARRLGVKNA